MGVQAKLPCETFRRRPPGPAGEDPQPAEDSGGERQLNLEDRERARLLAETLRSSGTWRNVAERILQEARSRRAWASGYPVSADGIAAPNIIEVTGEEEDAVDLMKDHPCRACATAHPGLTHQQHLDQQEEEEEERLSLLTRDAQESRQRVVQDPLLGMPSLRKLYKSESRDVGSAAAARRTWLKASAGVLEPAALANRAEERRRRRIVRNMER